MSPFAPAHPRRAPRGLLELTASLLCVWAAAYHTPAGALVRHAAARVTAKPSAARPLLAYYSGGTYDAAPPTAGFAAAVPSGLTPGALAPPVGTLTALPAVGRGVYAIWSQLPAREQAHARALAARHGVRFPQEQEEALVQLALTAALEREAAAEGGLDAAVLAAFAGHDAARFAAQGARAEGRTASLEDMVRWLPNGSGASVGAASRALALGQAWALAWPLQVPARVSSPFGYRTHPTLGRRQLHTGVDLAVPEGTQVRAAADGVVRRASEDALNGRVVIVDHGHGVSTAYCHNRQLEVAAGARVKAGDLLALSGSTGRSTGPHLHYQLELSRTPVDPLAFRAGPAAVASVPGARGF